MTRDRQPLPAYIRLALRDLKQNIVGSVVLAVVLGLAIAITLPGLINSYQRPYSQRVSFQVADASKHTQLFSASSQDGDKQTLQALMLGVQQPEKTKNSVKSVGLEPLEVIRTEVSFSGIPHPDTELSNVVLGTDDFLDNFVLQVSNADWTDKRPNTDITMIEGRLPRSAQEIAVNTQALAPYAATSEGDTMEDSALVDAAKTFVSTAQTKLAVGSTVQGEIGRTSTTLTVVGWYSSETFTEAIGASTDFENNDAIIYRDVFGYGSALSDSQAIELARHFSSEQQDDWLHWGVRNLTEDPALAQRAAFAIPFNQYERESEYTNYSSEPSVQTALILAGFISLVSIPLHWQNRRRRSQELTQLSRAGMSGRQQVVSQLIPAVAIGLGATVIGFTLSMLFLAPLGKFWATDLMPLSAGNSLLLAVAAAVALGLISTVVASIIPQIISRVAPNSELDDEESAMTWKASEAGSAAGTGSSSGGKKAKSGVANLMLPVMLMALGIIIACLTAAGESSIAPAAYCIVTMMIIVGTYYWFSRLFDIISIAVASKRVSLRLAARELCLQRVSSINAAVAIALVSMLGVTIATIFKQHALEYGANRNYMRDALIIASVLTVLLCAILYFVSLRGDTELRNLRTPLTQQGLHDDQLRLIDGYRTLILAVLGCVTGYLLGTGVAAAALITRVTNGPSLGLEPLSFVPSLATFVAVIVPILAAFYIGQLAGQHNLSLTNANTNEREYAGTH